MRRPNNWTDALKLTLRSTFVAVALLLLLPSAGGGLGEEWGRAVGISSQSGDIKAAWHQEGGASILPEVTVPVRGDGPQCDVDRPDLSGEACSPPGEVSGLLFVDRQTLVWSPPADPGTPPAVLYDTLRTTRASDFTDNFSATCIESDGGDQTTAEAEDPPLGWAFLSSYSPNP